MSGQVGHTRNRAGWAPRHVARKRVSIGTSLPTIHPGRAAASTPPTRDGGNP
jgi:hypothetical protein